MSQEVIQRLVSRLQPQWTLFISRLQPIDPNHLQTSWDIQVGSMCMVYLPTCIVAIYRIYVGKYTIPMDCMGK